MRLQEMEAGILLGGRGNANGFLHRGAASQSISPSLVLLTGPDVESGSGSPL